MGNRKPDHECDQCDGAYASGRHDAYRTAVDPLKAVVAALEDELAEMKAQRDAAIEALKAIATDAHCSYPERSCNGDRQYDLGVADGHRCAAEKARASLAKVTP